MDNHREVPTMDTRRLEACLLELLMRRQDLGGMQFATILTYVQATFGRDDLMRPCDRALQRLKKRSLVVFDRASGWRGVS